MDAATNSPTTSDRYPHEVAMHDSTEAGGVGGLTHLMIFPFQFPFFLQPHHQVYFGVS